MNHIQSHTPDNVEIKPRNRQHDFSDELKSDWVDQDAFKTAWFNAMSITFPLGEKFFIDSTRYYTDQIQDPKLREDLSHFCGQEGFHRREHQHYNETLCSVRGYSLDIMEGPLRKRLSWVRKNFSPIQQLAATAAVEHITAILAEFLLSESTLDNATPVVANLWRWHAAEEMEHKSVAFDIYRAVGGKEKMRKVALKRATLLINLDILRGVIHILRTDGLLWKPNVWWCGACFLFGRKGIMWAVRKSYMEFYTEGFHPWQQDTRNLLLRWQQQGN